LGQIAHPLQCKCPIAFSLFGRQNCRRKNFVKSEAVRNLVLESQLVALSGLLHDIGKFSQRVGNEQRWQHDAFTETFLHAFSEKLGEAAEQIIALAVSPHQQVTERESLCVKLADWLASAERQRKVQPQIAPERTALIAIPSQVQLAEPLQSPVYVPLSPLTLTEGDFFPTEESQVRPDDYRKAWDEFAEILRDLPPSIPFRVWLTLLQVFTHAIPSATPWEREPEKRTVPDISLFHHARLTAAIATCLAGTSEKDLPTDELLQLRDLLSQFDAPDFLERLRQNPISSKPLCLLVRGDVAGIQSWLYRIARAEGEEHRRTAKRLRGRSFYLVLLTQAIAEWLCRKAKVPPCNIIFCGGGVFDVLLPVSVEGQIKEWRKELDDWLLREFHGDLQINMAWVSLSAADFYDFGSVSQRITAELERNKTKVLTERLDSSGFWFREVADICRYCDTTPFADPTQPCEQCKQQEKLGDALRKADEANYLVWAWDDATKAVGKVVRDAINFSGLSCCVAVVSEGDAKRIVEAWDGKGDLVIAKRNDPYDWWRPLTWDRSKPVQATIWWAASDAPVAKKRWQAPTKRADEKDAIVHEGEALDFDEIAGLSEGSPLLGILRMDVDNLGAIFAVGVEPPSPSRIAELSGRMDIFFSGWLRERCYLLTREWQSQLHDDDKRKGLVDNAFYLVYAGGDDLMVIGPWNLTLWLAWHIHNDLTRYCGNNPNMTISAGVIFVKPKFPIYRFAVLAGEALEQSKGAGRNRITAFGVTVGWDEFKEALEFGDELRESVERQEMPRTLLHFLLRLYRTYVREDGENPMWAPLLHYTLARRLETKVIEQLNLLERIPDFIRNRSLPVALGYAILATRERIREGVRS